MKKNEGVTVIAQVENADLSTLIWLNNLISKSNMIKKAFLVCRELALEAHTQDDLLEDLDVITNHDSCLDEYEYNPSNDLLIISPLVTITDDAVNTARALAYERPEIGSVSPVCFECEDKQLPDCFWGLSNYIAAEADGVTAQFLYLKSEAVLPLRTRLRFIDFIPPHIAGLLKDMTILGYKCIICDELVLNAPISSQDLKQEDFYRNVELQQKIHNKRKNLLYVIQADFRTDASNNIGGTQLHVKDLVSAARREYNVFVAVRNHEFLQVTAYLPQDTLTFKFYIGPAPAYPEFYNAKQSNAFETILKGFQIDLIHVHHTYTLASDVFFLAKNMGIPVILTLHDFYYLCPTIKMFDKNGRCCIGKDSDDVCRDCLKHVMGINPEMAYMKYWRDHSRKILHLCDLLLTPSENAKNIIGKYFPDVLDKIRVVEHGYDGVYDALKCDIAPELSSEFKCNIEKIDKNNGYCISVEGWAYVYGHDNSGARILLEATDSQNDTIYIPAYRYERQDVARDSKEYLKSGFQAYLPQHCLADGEVKVKPIVEVDGSRYCGPNCQSVHYHSSRDQNLNVAFIGGLNPAKGSGEIFNIITQGPSDVNWFIFGGIDDPRLAKLKRKNLVKTNFYQRDELQTYLDLHSIDVICILSLWPETFCYTLSEAVAYKRPVIVTDIGALGERTKAMGCGWTVSLQNITEEVLQIVNRIKDKEKEFEVKRTAVEQIQLRSLSDMNAVYSKLYLSLLKKERCMREYDSKALYLSWEKPKKDGENQKTRQITAEEYQNYIVQLEQEIERIKISRSYKIAQILSKIWSKFNFLRRIRG